MKKIMKTVRAQRKECDKEIYSKVCKLMKEVSAKLMETVTTAVGNEHDHQGPALHRVWEYFATALLPNCGLFGDNAVRAKHNGGPNDWGADVLLYSSQGEEEKLAVVQVKGGRYFQNGKGNSIVLCLVGSCVCYGVTEGIIFSSESDKKLTDKTEELIEEFKRRGYTIQCLFIEDILRHMKKPNAIPSHAKADVFLRILMRLHELLK